MKKNKLSHRMSLARNICSVLFFSNILALACAGPSSRLADRPYGERGISQPALAQEPPIDDLEEESLPSFGQACKGMLNPWGRLRRRHYLGVLVIALLVGFVIRRMCDWLLGKIPGKYVSQRYKNFIGGILSWAPVGITLHKRLCDRASDSILLAWLYHLSTVCVLFTQSQIFPLGQGLAHRACMIAAGCVYVYAGAVALFSDSFPEENPWG